MDFLQKISPKMVTRNRRVHEEGVKMLEEHYIVLEERKKLEQMQNRIKRLEFEEKRAI